MFFAVLPFVKSPDTHPTFEMYFTRPWLDTFTLSLNNFLSTVLQNIPLPTLLSFDDEQVKLRAMADEIAKLRSRAWDPIGSTGEQDKTPSQSKVRSQETHQHLLHEPFALLSGLYRGYTRTSRLGIQRSSAQSTCPRHLPTVHVRLGMVCRHNTRWDDAVQLYTRPATHPQQSV